MRTLITALALATALSGLAGAQNNPQPKGAPLVVSFILIKADNSGRTDPSLGGLDSTLRGVLRFTGYRGIAAGSSQAYDGRTFDLTFIINTNRRTVRVFCTVEHLSNDTNPATAQLRLRLAPVDSTDASRVLDPAILTTGLTIPEKQTVVVGGDFEGGGLALAVSWKKGTFGQKE